MIEVTEFGGQNWLITPAAVAVNQPAPKSINEQLWLLVLSGAGILNFAGQKTTDWSRDEAHILPDMIGPLDWAIGHYSIPRPAGTEGQDYNVKFELEQWSPFASLNSVYDEHESIDAGYAVDDWRPSPFETDTDIVSKQSVGNIFTGIIADVAVRDSDAFLYRVGYNITLKGRIVFAEPPVIF
jgi:hypothetical protein